MRQYSSVQFRCSVMSDFLRPHGLQHNRPPVHCQLPEFTQTHVHWVGDPIQPSHPLSSPNPPALHWVGDPIQPSHPLSSPNPPTLNLSQNQGLFKWVSSSHQVNKLLQLSYNISPSNEYSGLISFSMDWLDLLAVQGTLKSLLQHHRSKASFVVQLSL